jgi:biotin operon repressor
MTWPRGLPFEQWREVGCVCSARRTGMLSQQLRVVPDDDTLRQMSSAEETRLIEVLITHNEPVSCEDLACALGMTHSGVQQLAAKLQTLGYVIVDGDNEMVAATPAADAAVRGGLGHTDS